MSETDNTEPKRLGGPPETWFKPGNPGRPKGSKNKLTEDFLSDVLEAWQERGSAAISAMIDEKPGDFVKMVATLVPKEATLNINDNSELTDEQLAERIRQITSQLSAFVIDGTGDIAAGLDGEAGAAIAHNVH